MSGGGGVGGCLGWLGGGVGGCLGCLGGGGVVGGCLGWLGGGVGGGLGCLGGGVDLDVSSIFGSSDGVCAALAAVGGDVSVGGDASNFTGCDADVGGDVSVGGDGSSFTGLVQDGPWWMVWVCWAGLEWRVAGTTRHGHGVAEWIRHDWRRSGGGRCRFEGAWCRHGLRQHGCRCCTMVPPKFTMPSMGTRMGASSDASGRTMMECMGRVFHAWVRGVCPAAAAANAHGILPGHPQHLLCLLQLFWFG